MRKERNFGLDLVRAIAITLVVVSHSTFLFTRHTDNIVVILMRTMGAVGVDLFFVLSGFLIGGILLKQIDQKRTKFADLITFWKRRWWRTLPNYFLMLLINIIIFYIFSKDLPETIGSYFIFLQNFSTAQAGFFTESWSLSIEEYAYLFLPFFIYCGFLFFKNRDHSVFIWATLAIIFVGLLLKLQFYLNADLSSQKNWSAMFRKVVIYRLDSIYTGFVLVYLMRHWPISFQRNKNRFIILGASTFVGMHLLIYVLKLQPETHLYFYVFMYLPLISISCALSFPFALGMKRSKLFGGLIYFVSTRSYAIYLINFSAILLCFYYLVDFKSASLLFKIGICTLYLILTLGISNLVYTYFEKPILDYRDRTVR